MNVPDYLKDRVPAGADLLDLILQYRLGTDLETLAVEYDCGPCGLHELLRTDRIRDRTRKNVHAYNQRNPDKVRARCADWAARVRGARGRGLTAAQWRQIVEAWGGRCAYCRRTGPVTVDHIIPVSKDGRHEPENIAPACLSCNTSKSARLDWKPATVAYVAKRACALARDVA